MVDRHRPAWLFFVIHIGEGKGSETCGYGECLADGSWTKFRPGKNQSCKTQKKISTYFCTCEYESIAVTALIIFSCKALNQIQIGLFILSYLLAWEPNQGMYGHQQR